jgi:hypothetical protein
MCYCVSNFSIEKSEKIELKKEIITKRPPLTEDVTNYKDYAVVLFITTVTCVPANIND